MVFYMKSEIYLPGSVKSQLILLVKEYEIKTAG